MEQLICYSFKGRLLVMLAVFSIVILLPFGALYFGEYRSALLWNQAAIETSCLIIGNRTEKADCNVYHSLRKEADNCFTGYLLVKYLTNLTSELLISWGSLDDIISSLSNYPYSSNISCWYQSSNHTQVAIELKEVTGPYIGSIVVMVAGLTGLFIWLLIEVVRWRQRDGYEVIN